MSEVRRNPEEDRINYHKARASIHEAVFYMQRIGLQARCEMIEIISDNYCLHCGSSDGYMCFCMRDD